MKQAFLEKYFLTTKLNSLKKSLSNIEQQAGETLYDYYERFKRLCSSCPYHGYSNEDLILYLYGGLFDDERRMVNAACGGNILNKTPAATFELFFELSEGSRQFSKKSSTCGVNMADSSSSVIRSEMAELKDMMKKFMMQGTTQQVKACGICADISHATDACPQLQEPEAEVNVVGGFGPSKPRYDPYSNSYNPGWRDHPNLRYGNPQQQHFQGGQMPRPPFYAKP
jgi:hypothetical protein